jgi:hypothetical protein
MVKRLGWRGFRRGLAPQGSSVKAASYTAIAVTDAGTSITIAACACHQRISDNFVSEMLFYQAKEAIKFD